VSFARGFYCDKSPRGYVTAGITGTGIEVVLDMEPELKERLGLESVPDEEKGRYQTLSGMMMWLIGKVPRTGDSTQWQGWRLEVVDRDGNRVDKVMAVGMAEPDGETSGQAPPPVE